MATVFYGSTRTWQQNLPYTGVTPGNPSLADCADANGSLNNPDGDTGLAPVTPFVPRDNCVGDFTIGQGDCGSVEDQLQEDNAAQVIATSGAAVNIFKYLGIHEQGKLIDLVGNGKSLGSQQDAGNVFNSLAPDFVSVVKGIEVVKAPAYVGYDFGMKKTSQGSISQITDTPEVKMITSLRIQQPVNGSRAIQIRVDQSNGDFYVNPFKINPAESNQGNVTFENITVERFATLGSLMLFAESATTFMVTFISSAGETKMLGTATVGQPFKSMYLCFTIKAGSNPTAEDDSYMIPIDMKWQRVDVVNLPNIDAPATVQIRQSAPARYWRIVPVIFQGVTNPDASWIIRTVELYDVAGPSLDDIQDTLFMENRDRDYARTAIQIRAAYTPFDAVSDLSKFGFQIADIYTFTTTFNTMVKALGRPIVIGDVLELPSELQYDHHLRPVRKFLEVTDVGWAADGFTTSWKPIIYKFQAQQLIPGQEHQSLFGNVETQKYGVTDEQMFEGLQQIQTVPLTASQRNEAEAEQAVSRTGIEHLNFTSGADWMGTPGTYDGKEYGMENAIPPDGQPYETGMVLPDRLTAKDREFFRLEYEAHLNLPARLYQFSARKGSWIHIETDRRQITASHNKNQRRVFNSIGVISPTDSSIGH